ncbi:unnamed protein product [Spirodela intermedia]|uniref:Ornithine aminotransferase n=1 Tax=Spirodela intermedia TaxID=51605 RepID=A0A7I8JE89_SPIIN|nr:unnamed protein product [Spirodela intermedia]CAA6668075.1 unnamed protein product [Spirodela intermedia]
MAAAAAAAAAFASRRPLHGLLRSYHPIPMVFSRATGCCVWDPEGNKYIDFLSAYSAVNQVGGRITLSSRAFYNDKFPVFAELLTRMFGFEMTALKLARKWGYEKKGIPKDKAIIVSCCGCFHGRTLGVISMSCDNEAVCGFGPLLPGHMKVDFGDIEGLKKIFEEHGEQIAAFLFEPIQGRQGAARDLCSRHNVLMIADEIQTGLGRTGKLLGCDWEGISPDVVILGKALGAGVLPVSAVLADRDVMMCIKPGEHGSTFGGNPLSSAVAIASLKVIEDEGLADRAAELGVELRGQLEKVKQRFPELIKEVRGRGLLNAVELNGETLSPVSAFDICLRMKERGILAKPTHGTIIRLAPPLSISLEELSEAPRVLGDVLGLDVPELRNRKSPESKPPSPQPCHRCGRRMYSS